MAEHAQDGPPLAHRAEPADTKKKRRRPALSCEQCRRRKIRCDRMQPCSHCVKSKIPGCSYAPTHVPASWAKRAAAQTAKAPERPPSPPHARTILPVPDPKQQAQAPDKPGPASVASSQDITTSTEKDHSMHYLEEKLTQVVTLSNAGSPSSRDELTPPNSNAIKARYFGRGHWLRCTALVRVLTSYEYVR